jgi:hypothetical protein
MIAGLCIALATCGSCLAQSTSVHVHGQTTSNGYDVYPATPASLLVGSGATWAAPVTGSMNLSMSITWTYVVDWFGMSISPPTADGASTVVLERSVGASAASHLNCSAQGDGQTDDLAKTASVSGANPPVSNSATSSDTYTIQGTDLTFTLVGTNHWQATPTFHTSATSASAQATAPGGSKGSNSTGSGQAGLSNSDIVIWTLAVHPH